MIKESFYLEEKMKHEMVLKTISQLLNTIKLHSRDDEISEVIEELRETVCEYSVMCDVEELIIEMAKEQNLCPICSKPLQTGLKFNIHNEFGIDEGNRSEESMYYCCEECGYSDDE